MNTLFIREACLKEILEPPDEFSFPFKPYHIQHDFMKALYSALEGGKLGIFESPTGTGKSMSMVCGALTWLDDNEKRIRQTLEKESLTSIDIDDDSDDWIGVEAKKIEIAAKCAENKHVLKMIEAKEKEMEDLKKRVLSRNRLQMKNEGSKKLHSSSKVTKNEEEESNVSDDDCLLEDFIDLEEKVEDNDSEDNCLITKVFFCSRTHSQLSQLLSELRKSVHANKRVVCLASRQTYCVNPSVRALGSLSLMNDRCLDLQQGHSNTAQDKDGKTTKRARRCGGCPQKAQERVQELRDEILADINDVEELVKKGSKLNSCPYYAARSALKDAQVILLPYNTLLHASTRKAVGISLKGNIIIIDEAHNLLDTISHMHSAEVTGQQLSDALEQLKNYRSRYETRFSAINILRLDQLIFYIGRLLRLLEHMQAPTSTVYQLVEFTSAAGVENINPYILLEFCHKSKLPQKLRGFASKGLHSVTIHERKPASGLKAFLEKIKNDSQDHIKDSHTEPDLPTEKDTSTTKNPVLPILSFFECMTSRAGDGRIVCCRQNTLGASRLKFLLLNPAEHFRSVIEEARAVIVAGGTMHPISEFKDQLFIAAGGAPERLLQFSCDHIVPAENILPIILYKGPTGKILNFNYELRNTSEMILEVERILTNVCNMVPGGIVCFFPSYDYEQRVFSYLEKSGALEKLQLKKKVFREPKKSTDVDKILKDYAAFIRKSKSQNVKGGAIMLSVIGGKLSEGLNFSDDLGRLIVVIGMPYPNKNSPELQEKLKYLDTHVGCGEGNRHYEALCMKAVNQSIGRAIRHRADYAAVLLADSRYGRPNIQASLPGWIQRSLKICDKFGAALGQMRQFFASKIS